MLLLKIKITFVDTIILCNLENSGLTVFIDNKLKKIIFPSEHQHVQVVHILKTIAMLAVVYVFVTGYEKYFASLLLL